MIDFKAYTIAAYFLSTLPLVVPGPLREFSGVAGHEIDKVCNSLLGHRQHEFSNPRSTKIHLTNVRVFDGQKFGPHATVVINGAEIESVNQGIFIDHSDEVEVEVVDGNGGYLLPGFIDAHNHPESEEDLRTLARNGITTAMSQACFSKDACQLLKSFKGVTEVFYSGVPAAAPNSSLTDIPEFPSNETLSEPSQALGFIQDQIWKGADHIKIFIGPPGPPGTPSLTASVVNAVTYWAHQYGKRVCAHAPDVTSINIALDAGVEQIHHIAADRKIDDHTVARFVKQNILSVPTLFMMLQFHIRNPAISYDAAADGVTALHKAKVPILTGSDAHAGPAPESHSAAAPPSALQAPPVSFGSSYHDELYLLANAGLSTVDVLNAATINPAEGFGLHDRGVIAAYKRADLVLLKDDPINDINATRSVQRVWLAGQEYVDKKSSRSSGESFFCKGHESSNEQIKFVLV